MICRSRYYVCDSILGTCLKHLRIIYACRDICLDDVSFMRTNTCIYSSIVCTCKRLLVYVNIIIVLDMIWKQWLVSAWWLWLKSSRYNASNRLMWVMLNFRYNLGLWVILKYWIKDTILKWEWLNSGSFANYRQRELIACLLCIAKKSGYATWSPW